MPAESSPPGPLSHLPPTRSRGEGEKEYFCLASLPLSRRGASGRGERGPGGEDSRAQCPLYLIFLFLLLVLPGTAPAALSLAFEPYTLETQDGRRIEAELGWLAVPRSRSKPGGEPIRLAVLRLRSTSRKPGPPIVYLSGGPGGAGTAAAKGPRLPLFLALREAADVIALDVRGTGLSRPSLACRESWTVALDRPADLEDLLAAARGPSRTCAARLRAEGVDLAAYNTREIADDLEDLRRALGVPRIGLLGTSYGTQVALTAARRHGKGLDRLVLAGVQAPHQAPRLPDLLERQLAEISRQLGLKGEIERVRARLARQPVTVEVPLPLAGRTERVVAGRFDFEILVAQALSTREGIAGLPAKLRAMAGEDWSALGRVALELRRGWLGSAMPYAVQCATGISKERKARIRAGDARTFLHRALDFPFPGICEAWGVPDLGDGFRAPVRSRLPALFLSGSLDIRTPPENAEEVRGGFPNGVSLVIEGAGHGDDLLLSSPEIAEAIVGFFRGKKPGKKRITLPPLSTRTAATPPAAP